MPESNLGKWASVAAASVAGYFAVNRLYKHIRGRCEEGSDANWVCPGVGAAGALTAGGVAAYVLSSSPPGPPPGCPMRSDGVNTVGLPSFSLGG